VGCGKRVRNPTLGQDDQSALDGGPEPEDVCMPPQGTPLASDGEVVHILLSWLNWALRNVRWSISPTFSSLSYLMPAHY
jgi:hypothetical protein